MKRSLSVPLLGLVLLLSGCTTIFSGSSDEYTTAMPSLMDYGKGGGGGMMEERSYMAMDSSGELMAPSAEERKLIKTVSMSLHVTSVRDAVTQISEVVNKQEGDVIDSSVTRGDKAYSGYMNVRVPAAQLEATVAELKALALYTEYEYSNANDVTEQYVDLEARLNNKKAEEAQYLAILKDASTVTDTLAVTQALNQVRYEIESMEGQMKSYDSQIDYSSINITLTEDESAENVSATWDPSGTFKEAQSSWVAFLQGLVDGAIYLGVFAWPVLIVLLVIWYWRRNRKSKK